MAIRDTRVPGFDVTPTPVGPAGRTGRRVGQTTDEGLGRKSRLQSSQSAGARDPFNLDGAFGRLKRLLSLDAGAGPREDVTKRGFYLDIIV